MNAVDAFLLVTMLALLLVYQWLFRLLPRERWQFLATVPWRKQANGQWHGRNLTLYGLFSALAGGTACTTFLFLATSAGTPTGIALLAVLATLLACLPAAKWIAATVEKNPHGFTVGGASFVGVLLAPWLLQVCDAIAIAASGVNIPVMPLLAAMSIAYVLGEGIGRLACLSFGCCYGKPMHLAAPWLQRCCALSDHRYVGHTRKASFAGELEGVRVVPVQSATCVVYTLLALGSTSLFFHQHHTTALLLSLLGSQCWRLVSEQWRADFRGTHKHLSPYQWMSIVACVYIVAVSIWLPEHNMATDAALGITALWQPEVIITLQVITLAIFFYTGSSTITEAQIRFDLVADWKTREGLEKSAPLTTTLSRDAPADVH
ncbi:MAG: prolipoprotein diacylglyceryl transferase [Alcanivoracaceae bacterium]|nr:prolipoprotein diacylglyceryl transferase [Alcanivoracaceae bacterium]